MCQAWFRALYSYIFIYSSYCSHEVDTTIVPIVQMRRLSHTAGKWQQQHANPGGPAPLSMLLAAE